MNRYTRFAVLLIALWTLGAGLCGGTVSIGTWNVRILSDGSRDDSELAVIAEIISRYDLIALQEVRDTRVLERLEAMLPAYDYIASPPVGEGVKELYAFFYDASVVTPTGYQALLSDPENAFIREPFIARFIAGSFDCVIISIHVLWGDSKAQRREEIRLLDDVLAAVERAMTDERDILLVGDFNFDSADEGWEITGYVPLLGPALKTTISDSGCYDNIWIHPHASVEFAGGLEVYRFDEELFDGDDRAASLAVSDHRPVSVRFRTDGPDDD